MTFAAGARTADIQIIPVDDHVIERDETIHFILGENRPTYAVTNAADIDGQSFTRGFALIVDTGAHQPPPGSGSGGGGDEDPSPDPDAWVDVTVGGWGWWYGEHHNPGEQSYGSTQDDAGLTTGGFLRLNADFDESADWTGTGAPPRDLEKEGIVAGDGEVSPLWLGMWTDGESHDGDWTLSWDQSKAKVWAADVDADGNFTGYSQRSSGWSGRRSDFDDYGTWWYGWGLGAWVEPVGVSSSLDDLAFEAVFSPDEGSPVQDTAKLTVIDVDLDVDSDNDHTLAGDAYEDFVEALGTQEHPGKSLLVATGDTDNDGIPDFADGFNYNDIAGDEDDESSADALTEVRIKLSGIAQGSDTIWISYAAPSDPTQVTLTTTAPYFGPGTGDLRLWLTDTPASRDGALVEDGGNFLAPGEYTVDELDADGDGLITLWAEAITLSSAVADRSISVSWMPESGGFAISDDVRLMATDIQLLGQAFGEELFQRVYHFSSTDPSEPEDDLPQGSYALYKIRVLDPRTNPAPTVNFNGGQGLTLSSLTLGVHETPIFAVSDPSASSIPSAPNVIHLPDGPVEVSYNGRISVTNVRAKHIKPHLRPPGVRQTVKQINLVETQMNANQSWLAGYRDPITNALDHGAWGKELDKRLSLLIDGLNANGQQSRWMRSVYVDTATNKVVWVDTTQVPPGAIKTSPTVQQIDGLHMEAGQQHFAKDDNWDLAKVQAVLEWKSGKGRLEGPQKDRYLLLTATDRKKLFVTISQYGIKPGVGVVANNANTVLVQGFKALGLGLVGTAVARMVNAELFDHFEEMMSRADTAVTWAAKMAGGNVDVQDERTYAHKVSEFFGALNTFVESMLLDQFDIDGARLAEKFLIEGMYQRWVSQ